MAQKDNNFSKPDVMGSENSKPFAPVPPKLEKPAGIKHIIAIHAYIGFFHL